MKELEMILRSHGARYPKMEPTDAVKLIYQNEFAGGHMIRDELAARDFLRREYERVIHDPKAPVYESIGNGLVRVNLAALQSSDLGWVGDSFLRTAANHKGSMERFLQKLLVLKALTAEGIFSFDEKALEAYLQDYEKAGYPPVSHSESYRSVYRPAYRVIAAPK